MNAGQTEILVGQRIKVVSATGEDADLNGITGKATHPFAFGCTDKDWIGVYVDTEFEGKIAHGRMNISVKEIQLLED
jgi:hypothetical protein